MRQDEIWDVEAAQGYDTPGTGMFAPDFLDPSVDRLAALAAGGAALEFAVGTGRVAIPLAGRGVPVTGIELSGPMIDRLREKADEATVPVIVGDMATAVAPGSYTLVYLVFNAISNLLTQAEQVACFRNAARHLAPGGCFVIELEVPELRKLPPSSTSWASSPGSTWSLGRPTGAAPNSPPSRRHTSRSTGSGPDQSAHHPCSWSVIGAKSSAMSRALQSTPAASHVQVRRCAQTAGRARLPAPIRASSAPTVKDRGSARATP